MGLERERIHESKCIELGRLPSSRSCAQYKADAFTLVQDEERRVESLFDMGTVFRQMSGNDLQILAGIMLKERTTRKAGFTFMQKVYVRIGGRGRNYVNNFCMAYVLDADKEQIRLISENAKTAVTLPRDSDSVYSVEQFAPIRKEMYAERKYVDPEVKLDDIKRASALQTLEQADDAGALDTQIATRRKIKKVKHREDLVSFVARLNRGVIKTRKNEASMEEEITFGW